MPLISTDRFENSFVAAHSILAPYCLKAFDTITPKIWTELYPFDTVCMKIIKVIKFEMTW